MIVSYLVMPSNPDKISISMSLIEIFGLASTTTIVMFWGILGTIFAIIWNRFEPHNFEKITTFQNLRFNCSTIVLRITAKVPVEVLKMYLIFNK